MFELLASVLNLLFGLTKSYGFAIILLTVVVRLILFPLTAKQMRSMQGMSRIQPELKRLQAEHKDDRMKLQTEMTALYKREGINPVGGCLPLVMQIPVFTGLFYTIRGLSRSERLSGLQIAVPSPQYLSRTSTMYRSIVNGGGQLRSFGIDLAQSAKGVTGSLGTRLPFVALIVFYVASSFFQQHLANKRNPGATGQAAQMQKMMKWFPLGLGFFYYSMPAGLVLYFVASNLWTIGQQELLARKIPMQTPPADAVLDAKSELAEPAKSDASKLASKSRSSAKQAATVARNQTKSSKSAPVASDRSKNTGPSKNKRKGS